MAERAGIVSVSSLLVGIRVKNETCVEVGDGAGFICFEDDHFTRKSNGSRAMTWPFFSWSITAA